MKLKLLTLCLLTLSTSAFYIELKKSLALIDTATPGYRTEVSTRNPEGKAEIERKADKHPNFARVVSQAVAFQKNPLTAAEINRLEGYTDSAIASTQFLKHDLKKIEALKSMISNLRLTVSIDRFKYDFFTKVSTTVGLDNLGLYDISTGSFLGAAKGTLPEREDSVIDATQNLNSALTAAIDSMKTKISEKVSALEEASRREFVKGTIDLKEYSDLKIDSSGREAQKDGAPSKKPMAKPTAVQV